MQPLESGEAKGVGRTLTPHPGSTRVGIGHGELLVASAAPKRADVFSHTRPESLTA
jgi:hypothetical protein